MERFFGSISEPAPENPEIPLDNLISYPPGLDLADGH